MKMIPSNGDILDAIDKQFGQRNVYMWSTYILPNGHFLNPEKSEQSGNLTYEHADFDNWVYDIFGNEGIRVLLRNSIKMNVTYPYLYLPEERITANQILAIRQVLNKKDEFEYAVYDIADTTDNPNVLELLEPILIQTDNDDAVFDLSYQSASDIIKAISRYYSLGTFLNESKGLNEGLANNKQRGMTMERGYNTRYIDYKIPIEDIPRFLYHATPSMTYESIYRDGVISANPTEPLWDFSEPNKVYLATDEYVAYSFVETSMAEKDIEDEILILQIDTNHPLFNKDKLYADQNISYSVSEEIYSLEYRDDLSIKTIYELYEL